MTRIAFAASVLAFSLATVAGAQTPSPAQPDNTPAPAPARPAAASSPGTVQQQMQSDEAVAILGQPVQGPDKGEVGRVVDVLIDGEGHPRAAVLDFGGFLGLGNRRVAVDWKAMRFAPGDKDHPISLNLTTDQIKAAPEYKDTRTTNAVVVPSAPAAATGTQPAPSEQSPAPAPSSEPAPATKP